MSNLPIEVLVEGRLVAGHPMIQNVKTDNAGQPKLQADGITPQTEAYIGIAIPKGQETDWRQTPWGQQFHAAAVRDWPNGEHGSPTFAWKVTDGDSPVPNTKGKKPCDREGYPGHWVIGASTQFGIKCFHVGKYDPLQQIQDKNEIKCGDYCRVGLNVKGNGPCQSPGIYVNPDQFELSRPGVQIIVESGRSAAEVFGGVPAPSNTQAPAPAPGGGAPAPGTTVTPAPDFAGGPGAAPAPAPAPVVMYVHEGNQYTAEQLKAANWNDQQIAALPRV